MTEQEKVFDILNKFEFFQGQRAGRELWNDKPKEIQDKDISDFIKDINYIRSYLQDNILTLINELESENERLKTQLAQANAGIVNCSGCKLVEINAVNEFAEKVKNKLFEFFQDNEGLDGKISVGVLYVDVIGVEAKDGTIISLGLIDKLLKEYENEKRNNRMA